MSQAEGIIQEYIRDHPGSAKANARAVGFFPAGGATHTIRVRTPFRPYITRAEGSRKWDVDGHEYVDYVMGHGGLILGHGHPAVVEAVQEQTTRGIHFGDNHLLEIEWAEGIRESMPAAEQVEFFACGQEANLMAIRLARVFTGRRKVLRFDMNYHGWADELTAKDAPGAHSDDVTLIPANDVELAERHLATEEYALVMIEAGGGMMSGRVPTEVEFFQALPELARRHGTVMNLDEVVTGFREAPGGWQSVVGIEPDLTALGKAVSGGVPAGALVGRADILASLDPDAPGETVKHGGTWNALPLTCAAGVAALTQYHGGAPQRTAREMADALRQGANEALARQGVSGRVYGRSILNLYLGRCDLEPEDPTASPLSDPAEVMGPESHHLYERLDIHLLQRGVTSMAGFAFILSGAHSRADIAHTVEAFEASLAAMVEEGMLDREGVAAG